MAEGAESGSFEMSDLSPKNAPRKGRFLGKGKKPKATGPSPEAQKQQHEFRALMTTWCKEVGEEQFLVASRFLLKVSHNVITHKKDARYRRAGTTSASIQQALSHPSCHPLLEMMKAAFRDSTVALAGPPELYQASSIAFVAVRRQIGALEAWEEFPDMISLDKRLGAGEFGEVYSGQWRGNKVAVKTLRDEKDERSLLDFVREADIMRRFNHANVMSALCVVLRGTPKLIVLPLMEANLKEVLRSDTLDRGQQVSFASQLADALAYIHAQDVLHCDLAARNVLVANETNLKITDFGLARKAGSPECDTSRVVFPISVRWSAPEVFTTRILAKETDVWSWGVLLYEVLTAGVVPYVNYRNKEVEEKVKGGYRLSQPPDSDSTLFTLCERCWHTDPTGRPTAEDLKDTLEDLLKRCSAPRKLRLVRKGAVRQKKGQRAFSEFMKKAGLILDHTTADVSTDDLLFIEESSTLEAQPFYFGVTPRKRIAEEIEPLMRQNGEFAVSSIPASSDITVSVMWDYPRHITVAAGPDGQYFDGTQTFPSAFALLVYHINNHVPLLDDDTEVQLLQGLSSSC